MDIKIQFIGFFHLTHRIKLLFVTCLLSISYSAGSATQVVNDSEFKALVEHVSPFPVLHQKKAIRIAIVYPGIQVSDYWQRSLSALRGRLDDLGIDYTLDIRFTKPHVEQERQEIQIMELLERDPDYLVYTINSIRQQRMVEALLHQAKPKIIIQNLTRPIADWYDVQPLMYIGFDHAEGAKILAEYFKQRFPQDSEYGIVFWGRGVISDERGLTFEREIGSYHQLKISYFTEESRGKAKLSVLAMLKSYPNLKYIYASATDISFGALDALNELGRSDVAINGWGGGLAELDAFKDGLLDVVLMRVNDQSGIAMAEAIRLDMLGKSVPKVYAGDFRLLTKGMDESLIERYIKEAFVYSGSKR